MPAPVASSCFIRDSVSRRVDIWVVSNQISRKRHAACQAWQLRGTSTDKVSWHQRWLHMVNSLVEISSSHSLNSALPAACSAQMSKAGIKTTNSEDLAVNRAKCKLTEFTLCCCLSSACYWKEILWWAMESQNDSTWHWLNFISYNRRNFITGSHHQHSLSR